MNDSMPSTRQGLTVRLLLVAFIVFIFLYATSQLIHPYISHDDWDFLAPVSWGLAYSTPWEKTLTEGRWLSYLWSDISTYFTPQGSYLFFIISYLFLVCGAVWQAAKPHTFVLAALAIFFSPMLGQLSLWPTGMSGSVLLCGLAMWMVLRLDERFATAIVFSGTLLLVLAYPPLASVLLLTAAAKKANSPIREHIYLGAAYVVGFAAGSCLIFILNLIFHGYFGVKVASWRTPHPLHDLTDLIANGALYVQYWTALAHTYLVAICCGGLAITVLLCKKTTRKGSISILLATAAICSIELGITLVTGTAVPTRSAIWLWLSICLLCILVAGQPRRSYRCVGSILLVALALAGGTSWWNLYRQNQPAAEYQAHLAAWIQQYQAMTGISEVTVVGDPRRVADLRSLWAQNAMPAFEASMLKRYGIKVAECSMDFCDKVRRYLRAHDTGQSPIFVLDGKLALVFDRNGTSGNFERNYPTKAEESALHLSYPLFLSYGADALRITPFFPDSSRVPLSVKLASNASGYTLAFEGKTCAFPVNYDLTSTSGAHLAEGQYHDPMRVDLPGWNSQMGIGVLTVRMADDAKNNFGCNIVITKK